MSSLTSTPVKKNRRGSRGKGTKSNVLIVNDKDSTVSQSYTNSCKIKVEKAVPKIKNCVNTKSSNTESCIRSVASTHKEHSTPKIEGKNHLQNADKNTDKCNKPESIDNINVNRVCKSTKSPKLNVSDKVNRKVKHAMNLYDKIEKRNKYKSKVSPKLSNSSIQSCIRDLKKLRISSIANKQPRCVTKKPMSARDTTIISEVKTKDKSKIKSSPNSRRDSIESCTRSFRKWMTSNKNEEHDIYVLKDTKTDVKGTQINVTVSTSGRNYSPRKKNVFVNSVYNNEHNDRIKINKKAKTLSKEFTNSVKDAITKQKASAGSVNNKVDKIDVCIRNIEKVKMALEGNKKGKECRNTKKNQEKDVHVDVTSGGSESVNNFVLSTEIAAKQLLHTSEKEKVEYYSDDELPLLKAVQNIPFSKKQKWKSKKMSRQNQVKLRFKENRHGGGKNDVKKNTSINCSEEIENISSDTKKIAKRSRKTKTNETFPTVMETAKILEVLEDQDPNDPEYVQGNFRINPKFYKHGYLSMPGSDPDLLIIGLCDRNRAFDGDYVAARIKPEKEWHTHSDGSIQKTGVVVCILEKVHSRKAVGFLRRQGSSIFLYPRDQRVPIVRLYPETLPKHYFLQPDDFEDVLFLADIVQWKIPQMAFGRLSQIIGVAGDIKSESLAILSTNDLDVAPYSSNLVDKLPTKDYVLTSTDIADREDWRHVCIFTIDPATATDLDDALSCKVLCNGNYEIGIHISDVTHYLKYGSPLDIEVSKRSTTVYTVDNVYHMLPKQLCEVCSLLPGYDRLALSIILEMTPDAEIVKRRFTKTVINSCCQMSYDKAQLMINTPDNDFPDNFLDIEGNFTTSQLSVIINQLYKLSTKLSNKRFAEGALKIDQPKLHVIVDSEMSLPISYYVEERTEAKSLIEEFMLLANMEVASYLYATIPQLALLRRHKKPSEYVLKTTREMLQMFGVHLDTESAGSLQASIKRYEAVSESEVEEMKRITKYRMMVINNLCAKAMTCAEYKCSSSVKDEEDLRHYALNVPLYTHFTSPIRRYSDCVVHRLLYATIKNEPLNDWTSELCAKIANICTRKKYCAKVAQQQSNELYFAYLVELQDSITTIAIVLDVKAQSIDVILCHFGIKLRIYLNSLKDKATITYSTDFSVPTISITWKKSEVTQVINVFSLLRVQIEKHPELFCLTGTIVPP